MSYMLANETHVISVPEFKFMPIRGVGTERILTHSCMRSLVPNLESIYGQLSWRDSVELNNLTIHFSNFTVVGGTPIYDWHRAIIKFPDKRGRTVELDFSANPSFQYSPFEHEVKYLSQVAYELLTNKISKQVVTEFSDSQFSIRIHFEHIAGLGSMRDSGGLARDKFCFGIKHTPYSVIYHGRKLEGSCYAFLCGTWAILLDDDLSFDSLVTLRDNAQSSLVVDKFLYTQNSYILKVLMLRR